MVNASTRTAIVVPSLAALIALSATCSVSTAQFPPLEQALAPHIEHLGGPTALGTDFVITSTVHATPVRRQRTFVRREPFGFRQETETGIGTTVHISDGRHAWRLRDGKGELLTGEAARLVLEAACVDGLRYAAKSGLDPRRLVGPIEQLPMPPGVPLHVHSQAPVQPIAVMLECGTEVRLYFDALTGRLRGLANTGITPQRNVRYGDDRRFGVLQLPASRWENRGADAPVRIEIDAIQVGPCDPALFLGNPVPAREALTDAAPLERWPTSIPGSYYFIVPKLALGEQVAVAALFDTGAPRLYVDTLLADQLGLPVLSRRRTRGITGSTESSQRWLEAIAMPGLRLHQVEAATAHIPPTTQVASGAWPGIVLGGEILTMGPVLDLQRRRLLVRGRSIVPLEGANVFTLPLSRATFHDLDTVPVEIAGQQIEAVLDTGMAVVLRLSSKGLQKIGLPIDVASWRARGAVPLQISGAGLGTATDLLVQLDSVRFGRVLLARPWVLLALDAAGSGAFYDAALGAGALSQFARVGLDASRSRLEHEPGSELVKDADGWRAPAPGVFLGLRVRTEEPRAGTLTTGLLVVEVSPATPAAAAGIRPGDRVLRIDGMQCTGELRAEWIERLWARSGACTLVVRGGNGQERQLVLPR